MSDVKSKIPPYRRNYQKDERTWFGCTSKVRPQKKVKSLSESFFGE